MTESYKLTYFDLRGRAEGIRFLFAYAGIEFEDDRIPQEDWPDLKPTVPYRKLPILEVDGKIVNQTLAIERYLARQFELSGRDDWENLQCESLVENMADLQTQIKTYFFETDEEVKEVLRESLLDDGLALYFTKFEEILEENDGSLVESGLTWADIHFAAALEYIETILGSEILDEYPHLKALKEKVFQLPGIQSWVENRPETQF